jgi:hypothetical protein
MPCVDCGGGDRWIKTCLTPDGSRIRVCDPCYEACASELVIVPGDVVVTARCNGCGAYFSTEAASDLLQAPSAYRNSSRPRIRV